MLYFSNKSIQLKTDTVITLGNFDGIHKGHQKLIDETKQYAKNHNINSVIFSFAPHPLSVLANKEVLTIMTPEEKRFVIESFNVDIFVEYPFDKQFSQITPEAFVKDILKERMNCKALIVGEDYTLGKNKSGTVETLKSLGEMYGIEVFGVPNIIYNEKKISSSVIRNHIMNSEFNQAEIMMGRPYLVMGFVSTGRRLGRTIGFPTVNIEADKNKILPSNGVYITKSYIKGALYNSITNVGFNPTVGGQQKKVETFIMDFSETVYGEKLVVYFYKRIRGESNFNSLEQLKCQIHKDVSNAKIYFEQERDCNLQYLH